MDHDERDEPAIGNENTAPDFALDEKTTGGFNAWFHSLPHVSEMQDHPTQTSAGSQLGLTLMLLTGARGRSFLRPEGESQPAMHSGFWGPGLPEVGHVPGHAGMRRLSGSMIPLTQGFYTTHGDNALYIARTFYKTTAGKLLTGAWWGHDLCGSALSVTPGTANQPCPP